MKIRSRLTIWNRCEINPLEKMIKVNKETIEGKLDNSGINGRIFWDNWIISQKKIETGYSKGNKMELKYIFFKRYIKKRKENSSRISSRMNIFWFALNKNQLNILNRKLVKPLRQIGYSLFLMQNSLKNMSLSLI